MSTVMRFEAAVADGLSAYGERLTLEASFRFTTEVEAGGTGAVETRREFEQESIVLRGVDGATYCLVGGARCTDERRFVRVYDGVLVGTGAQNNNLLSIAVEFSENADGTATAEVVAPPDRTSQPEGGKA